MNRLPLISVIVPIYSIEKYLKQCIDTILCHTYPNLEVALVNDRYQNKRVERLQEFKDSRIFIIDKLNDGVFSARNRRVEEANFEWIAFLDGGDLWESDYLLEMNILINYFPDSTIYGSNYFVRNNTTLSAQNNILSNNFGDFILNYYQKELHGLLYWTSSNIINRNKATNALFYESISLGEDLYFWIHLSAKSSIVYYNKTLAVYNQDGPNRATNKKHDIEKNFIYYSDKYKELGRTNKNFEKLIDYSSQSVKHRCFFLPFILCQKNSCFINILSSI